MSITSASASDSVFMNSALSLNGNYFSGIDASALSSALGSLPSSASFTTAFATIDPSQFTFPPGMTSWSDVSTALDHMNSFASDLPNLMNHMTAQVLPAQMSIPSSLTGLSGVSFSSFASTIGVPPITQTLSVAQSAQTLNARLGNSINIPSGASSSDIANACAVSPVYQNLNSMVSTVSGALGTAETAVKKAATSVASAISAALASAVGTGGSGSGTGIGSGTGTGTGIGGLTAEAKTAIQSGLNDIGTAVSHAKDIATSIATSINSTVSSIETQIQAGVADMLNSFQQNNPCMASILGVGGSGGILSSGMKTVLAMAPKL